MAIQYKSATIDCGYRLDLIVERQVIVELKSVQTMDDIFVAQVLSYLKLL